ncbi:MAG: bifunctional methylenetetrahydrofolate dehydrogenase/methenyltetrahydrofolate cyclohydrolase FolD [Acidobacteria bacterium]|nr:bifunctional methylenetetrahydrofolate dehydrogenase/methenyltetrahydrofolate cyclohydrolase FolD [Acidobacteriota bacterium]
MSRILDGKWVRDEIQRECLPRVRKIVAQAGRAPRLAVILAGSDPGSEIYVRNKVKVCQELGIASEKLTPSESVTTAELLAAIEELNRREEVDGILVQLPLPKQAESRAVLAAIQPEKDVDGFHPVNVGHLVANRPGLRPCTPAGIMELLRRYEIPVAGRRAVVVGRSDIVGKPMALMLLHQHATVTICHSRTSNLAEECARADILVAAIGKPALVRREFIKPGATVIDVGMNRLTDGAQARSLLAGAPEKLALFEKNGSVLVGDVHPAEVALAAGAYTPVPGGVGLLTVAMLMVNTIAAAERRLGLCSA